MISRPNPIIFCNSDREIKVVLYTSIQIILYTYYLSSIISQMDFEVIFQKLGRFNYAHRLIVLMGTLTVFIVFAVGLVNIRLETSPQSLWVSQDSIGYQQELDFNNNFGAFFRTEQIIMAQNDDAERNIFDHDHLYGLYFLQSLINKKGVYVNDREVKIENLCYRPISVKGCYRPSPLDLWKMDIGTLANDTEIQYTALCIETPKTNSYTSNMPCSDENEIPIIKQSIFGGIRCNQTYDLTSNHTIPCDHCWITSQVLMATYLLNNDDYTKESAEQWQKQVLLDSIHKYNADNGSFITEYAKHFKMDASGNVNATGGKVLNINDYTSSKLNVHFEVMAERSIPDELENETGENLWIVVISYAAMFAYIGVAIGQFPSRISSGFTLAVIGIMIVLASVLASMGLISYLGIGFTMISAEVIPFLILAIGVDNMFIIKNAIERQKYENLEDRVAHGLREVGPSITTAAICEALAFLVGSLTKMPALQAFCLQAATAILFNYIFQITIFVVAFIFDEERKAKNQMDVLCCVTRQGGENRQPRNFWKKRFGGGFYRLLKTKPCGFAVLAISVALLALAVVGVGRIPVGLSEQVSMTVDSDLYNYFTYEKKYIEIGPPAYIVLNNFEYRNATQQAYIKTLTNEISKLKYIQPPVYSWFSTFNNFILQGQEWTEACGAINVDKLPYEQQLKMFMQVSIEAPCCQNYGICGEQYVSDLRFDDEGKLISSRLRVMTKPLRNSADYIRAARQTRLAVDYVMKDLTNDNSTLEAYPYSLFYVYYDQYSYIRSVAIENTLLGIAVVFFVVMLIQNIKVALLICGVVLLVTIDLVGWVWATSALFPDHGFVVQVNAISVVNLITCIGLSVEFTAHVVISMCKLTGTQDQKLKETLQNTGCSVFIGIGLTKFVGVLVLALASSTLFRLYYFRMYLGIILLGLFNGLVLMPVALYWFGPKTSASGETLSAKETLLSKGNSEVKDE